MGSVAYTYHDERSPEEIEALRRMGQGWDGISMGFSNRNLLGVEWVTPDGRIAQIGSFDATGRYFCGDGPGFSLRGAFRGFAGALGGLGVFTKTAVKVYPWTGPDHIEFTGTTPEYQAELPAHHAAGLIVLSSWDAMAEVGYAVGEAEIVDLLGRNAPSLASAVMTVDNNAFAQVYGIPFLQKNRYVLGFVILGRDSEDLRYRMKTLKKIVKQAGGGLVTNERGAAGAYWKLRALWAVARDIGWGAIARSVPGLLAIARGRIEGIDPGGYANLGARLYGGFVRNHMQMRGCSASGVPSTPPWGRGWRGTTPFAARRSAPRSSGSTSTTASCSTTARTTPGAVCTREGPSPTWRSWPATTPATRTASSTPTTTASTPTWPASTTRSGCASTGSAPATT
jgi:hypothetical protein